MSEPDFTQLENLYFDTETGFVGVAKLIQKAREKKLPYTQRQIRDWYKKQQVNQVYKQKKKDVGRKITTWNWGLVHADLMDVSRLAGSNNSVKFLLNVIHVKSRFVWSFPLTGKSAAKVAEKLEVVFKEMTRSVSVSNETDSKLSLLVDSGNEFKGEVTKLANKYHVDLHRATPDQKNAMMLIERFHKTLWGILKKYTYRKGSLKYIDDLDKLIANYNNTVHRSVGDKPRILFANESAAANINLNENLDKMAKYNQARSQTFEIGDTVRRRLEQKRFAKKSFNKIFSDEIYTIEDIHQERAKLDGGKWVSFNNLVKADRTANSQNETEKELKKADDAKRVDRRMRKTGLDRNVEVFEVRTRSELAKLKKQFPDFA